MKIILAKPLHKDYNITDVIFICKGVRDMKEGWDKKRGLRYRLARIARELKQAELAEKASCSQTTISKIEHGRDCRWSLAQRLKKILKVSNEYIEGKEKMR